jgi:galactokinase
LEFSEPGGMMDQYSTSLGDLIYLESEPKIAVTPFNPIPGTFILGDSMVKKDTLRILHRCKNNRLEIINKLKNNKPEFSLNSIDISEIANFDKFLTENDLKILWGTIKNRDILRQALAELQSINPHYPLIGGLLTKHHAILRDVLKVSTSKIEAMLEAALNAGALGGKINGSGGGGCMFAYAPKNPEAVAEAIEKVGGKVYIVESTGGSALIS